MDKGEYVKYKCLCCGYMTLETRTEFDICPVCFWEDDAYIIMDEKSNSITSLYNETEDVSQEKLLDIKSGANHGLTLREGQENYKKYGACEKDMKKHVRKPRKSEFSTE
ncbi:CPCC family cysteine-rich protein [Clostridium beijerinckii]|uniref:CPCC family cysteine-rich protein n=1 Tax=Clostridium beijerinckii TaxID=1520 RepID=UPI000564B3ED|nr:CPCC family cysteine-rich protein [Clostridium beijerinckii]